MEEKKYYTIMVSNDFLQFVLDKFHRNELKLTDSQIKLFKSSIQPKMEGKLFRFQCFKNTRELLISEQNKFYKTILTKKSFIVYDVNGRNPQDIKNSLSSVINYVEDNNGKPKIGSITIQDTLGIATGIKIDEKGKISGLNIEENKEKLLEIINNQRINHFFTQFLFNINKNLSNNQIKESLEVLKPVFNLMNEEQKKQYSAILVPEKNKKMDKISKKIKRIKKYAKKHCSACNKINLIEKKQNKNAKFSLKNRKKEKHL